MTEDHLGDLLQPSLEQAREPLYSVRASFFVAFFGGAYAAALFGAINAARAGRLKKDLWIAIAAAIGWSALLFWAAVLMASDTPPKWLMAAGSESRTVRFTGRIVALAAFGLFHLRHRPYLRAQDFGGIDWPSPWRTGLACAVASIVATIGVLMIAGAIALT